MARHCTERTLLGLKASFVEKVTQCLIVTVSVCFVVSSVCDIKFPGTNTFIIAFRNVMGSN